MALNREIQEYARNGQCPCLLCCEHDIGHEGPHTYDVQAQIDAAYKRGVEDGLKRAKP